MRGRNKHIDFNYGQDSEESDEVSEEKAASKEKKKKNGKVSICNQNKVTGQRLNDSTQANTIINNFKRNGQLYVVQSDPHFKAITKRSIDDTDLLVNLYNTVVSYIQNDLIVSAQ